MNQVGPEVGARRRLRGQRGSAPLRVLIALSASTAVTAGVAVPMGYQAYQANQDEGPSISEPRRAAPPPAVAPNSATRDDPAVALPAPTAPGPDATDPTTEPTTQPSASGSPTTDGEAQPQQPTSSAPGPTISGPDPTDPPGTITPPPQSTEPPPTTSRPPTTAPIPSDGLGWTSSPRLRLQPLEGATLRGEVWVFYSDTPSDIVQVRFWLDDPDGAGPPDNTEQQFPFSLVRGPTNGIPGSLDTRELSEGTHTVRAEVLRENGTELRLARFVVDNR